MGHRGLGMVVIIGIVIVNQRHEGCRVNTCCRDEDEDKVQGEGV